MSPLDIIQVIDRIFLFLSISFVISCSFAATGSYDSRPHPPAATRQMLMNSVTEKGKISYYLDNGNYCDIIRFVELTKMSML